MVVIGREFVYCMCFKDKCNMSAMHVQYYLLSVAFILVRSLCYPYVWKRGIISLAFSLLDSITYVLLRMIDCPHATNQREGDMATQMYTCLIMRIIKKSDA